MNLSFIIQVKVEVQRGRKSKDKGKRGHRQGETINKVVGFGKKKKKRKKQGKKTERRVKQAKRKKRIRTEM